MQSGSRGGHGALVERVDRLVANLVRLLRITIEVRGNGYASTAFQHLAKTLPRIPREFHQHVIALLSDTLSHKFKGNTTVHISASHHTLLPFPEVAHHALPTAAADGGEVLGIIRRRGRLKAKHLDERPRALTKKQAGMNHFRVVKHEKVPRIQNGGDIVKTAFPNLSIPVCQKLGGIPLRQGKFGNSVVRQIIGIVFNPDGLQAGHPLPGILRCWFFCHGFLFLRPQN